MFHPGFYLVRAREVRAHSDPPRAGDFRASSIGYEIHLGKPPCIQGNRPTHEHRHAYHATQEFILLDGLRNVSLAGISHQK